MLCAGSEDRLQEEEEEEEEEEEAAEEAEETLGSRVQCASLFFLLAKKV